MRDVGVIDGKVTAAHCNGVHCRSFHGQKVRPNPPSRIRIDPTADIGESNADNARTPEETMSASLTWQRVLNELCEPTSLPPPRVRVEFFHQTLPPSLGAMVLMRKADRNLSRYVSMQSHVWGDVVRGSAGG